MMKRSCGHSTNPAFPQAPRITRIVLEGEGREAPGARHGAGREHLAQTGSRGLEQ